MDLKIYTEKKELLKSYLKQLYAIADDLELANQAKSIRDDIHFLDNEKFELVVVGEFSRGKSTFINAMLGRRILPSRKKATTAIISKIIYGDEPKFYLNYKDKKQPVQEISEEQFFKLTAPKELAPEEEKKEQQDFLDTIDFADIAYPLNFCRDNVEIVDTPGTNDLNEGRIEITYRYLNKADAVIMLLSATQALSNSEVEFLQERILGNHIQNIFFIISQKDKIDSASEEKVFNFVTNGLKKILPENISIDKQIFLVSSLQTLAYRMNEQGLELTTKTLRNNQVDSLAHTGFPEFEQALSYFLSEEKGRAKLNKYITHSRIIIEDLNKKLALQTELILHSADDLKAKVAEMEPEFNRAKHNVSRIIQNMRLNLESTTGDIENRALLIENNIHQAINTTIDNYDDSLYSTDKIKSLVNKAVTDEQRKFLNELQTITQEIISKEMATTSKALQKIWDDISLEYQKNFNLPMVVTPTEDLNLTRFVLNMENFEEKKNKYFAYASFVGLGLALTGFGLLPVAIGVASYFGGFFDSEATKQAKKKSKIKNLLNSHYSGIGDKMAKKLKQSYLSQIQEACQSIERTANARIDDMERQLQTVIKQKEAKEQDIEQETAILKNKGNLLQKINHELTALKI